MKKTKISGVEVSSASSNGPPATTGSSVSSVSLGVPTNSTTVTTSGGGITIVQGGEDLYTLEAEISELQRENARAEAQVLRLRSDITAMENQLKHGEKVSFVAVGKV